MTRSNVSGARKAKTGGRPTTTPCACCGIAPDPSGKPFSITFERPDVYFEVPDELLDTWGDDPFLAIKDVGFFVRVLLPLKLDNGFAVNFGTWLECHAEDFRQAWQTWNFPEYKDLEFQGYIGNAVAPLGKFPHALVKVAVRQMEDVPYVTSSDNEFFDRLLNGIHPHAEILKPYADLLKSEPPAQN
jgi:hypothetical protein